MTPIFSCRIDVVAGADRRSRDVLVIYCACDTIEAVPLAAIIRSEIEQNLEPDEILFLVRDCAIGTLLPVLASAIVAQVRRRLSGSCRLTAIGFDACGKEASRQMVAGGSAPFDVPLERIMRQGVTSIFRDRKGFVESTSNYHFENPSEKHTERFIRLSNILSRHSEISFIAFCTLPLLPADCRIIYIDTPALYPVVAAINDHIRALSPLRPFIMSDNFGSYQGVADYDFDKDDAVVLVSASSSGGLLDLLMSSKGFAADRLVHVLYLGKDRDENRTVCDLAFDEIENPAGYKSVPSNYRLGNCILCDSGSVAIPLHGDQFDLPGPQLDPLVIRKADAPEGLKKLVGRLAGHGVLGVGLGARDSGNPRQFNVEVEALLQVKSFDDEIGYALRRSTPVSTAYVIYLDKRSKPIAERVVNRLPEGDARPQLLSRSEIGKIPRGVTDPVVIVAAVIESGRSLLDISRDLRTSCRAAPLVYLVGINKTTGFGRRETLRANLAETVSPIAHDVIFIHRLLLPPSAEDHAWKRERDLLANIQAFGAVPTRLSGFVTKRLAELSLPAKPLVHNLFLANTVGHVLEVQPGFVFANPGAIERYRQAEVYFTIASILQKLRSNAEHPHEPRALRSNWFQQTVIAPDNFGRFNDGIIQASFLRAATPHELNYASKHDLSKEMSRIAGRIVSSARESRGEAGAEFLLAIATRRLILHPAHVEEVLQCVPAGMPVLHLLRKACLRALSRD
jgi:hypothetical protein